MDKETIYRLVTTDLLRCGTASRTTYSAMFAKRDSVKLNETEKAVMQMMEESDTPTCWKCGCVTGYPDALFTKEDWQEFSKHGLDTRFEI